MFNTGFSGTVSRTRLSPIRPVRKKAMPATRTAAMPLLTSMLSMRRDFPVRPTKRTKRTAGSPLRAAVRLHKVRAP